MNNFSAIANIISLVLGLSVTRLLIGLVTLFRIRHASSVDWVPVAWAAVLFSSQLEFWWTISQLPHIEAQISYAHFLFLVVMTLMLFLSSAVLLPNRSEDELHGARVYFEEDGRFALPFFSGFLLLAFFYNVYMLHAPLISDWAALDLLMIVLPFWGFFARTRKAYAGIALVYLPLSAVDIVVSLSN